MTVKIKKVKSLRELRTLAKTDENYQKLAVSAAENLGALDSQSTNWQKACDYLEMHAMSLEAEYGEMDGEKSIVEEVNFCLDLI